MAFKRNKEIHKFKKKTDVSGFCTRKIKTIGSYMHLRMQIKSWRGKLSLSGK